MDLFPKKSGEYEIDWYVLSVNSWSTPSTTGLYAIINNSDIITLDEALYSRKYPIKMQDLYPKLPQRYRDLKYVALTSSQQKGHEQILRDLVEQNLEVFIKIFLLSILPADAPFMISISSGENTIYPVKSDKFKTMADLENFVRSTYIKRTADRLLYNTHGQGPMYVEKDGKFCIDLNEEGWPGIWQRPAKLWNQAIRSNRKPRNTYSNRKGILSW